MVPLWISRLLIEPVAKAYDTPLSATNSAAQATTMAGEAGA